MLQLLHGFYPSPELRCTGDGLFRQTILLDSYRLVTPLTQLLRQIDLAIKLCASINANRQRARTLRFIREL